jgi:Leucine-rich repeat (LRR) protein
MDLTSNALVECVNLSHLTKLKRLWIDNNLLCNIIFKGLASLEFLSLSQNRIEHLAGLADVKKLVYLDLSGNRLTGNCGIPYLLCTVVPLQELLLNSTN